MSENKPTDQIKTQIAQTKYSKTVIGKIKDLLFRATFTGREAIVVVECVRFLNGMQEQADEVLRKLHKGEAIEVDLPVDEVQKLDELPLAPPTSEA